MELKGHEDLSTATIKALCKGLPNLQGLTLTIDEDDLPVGLSFCVLCWVLGGAGWYGLVRCAAAVVGEGWVWLYHNY